MLKFPTNKNFNLLLALLFEKSGFAGQNRFSLMAKEEKSKMSSELHSKSQ
jgi:hypothetical protein